LYPAAIAKRFKKRRRPETSVGALVAAKLRESLEATSMTKCNKEFLLAA